MPSGKRTLRLPQAKTMDVNARAGFYTEKSPKMLLHEWCIAQKRPTPRYRVTPADDGGGAMRCKVAQFCLVTLCSNLQFPLDGRNATTDWCSAALRQWAPVLGSIGCGDEGLAAGQVVLADPKDRDKDVVVFLGAEQAQQADRPEQAEQAAAVAALHRVAGERALHRVLPPAYRPLWADLDAKVG